MMSIKTMAIRITSKTKSATVTPKSKDELHSLIEQELEQQGTDADLNFIDTSLIEDMSSLFNKLKPRNIKIDAWDVSNVTDMSYMFYGCTEFNSDLSHWDVSNVMWMSNMFYCCKRFNADISSWNVSKVKRINNIFEKCSALPKKFRPKFKV